jgi:hypothetical protein
VLQNGAQPVSQLCAVPLTGSRPCLKTASWVNATEAVSGAHDVAKQTYGGAFSAIKALWCCKKKLENCHWVGKGGCDQNNCAKKVY